MTAERAKQIIDKAAEERRMFVDWVRGVPEEHWRRMSPGGIWQARDYVAHLAAIDPLLTAWFLVFQKPEDERTGGPSGVFSIDAWNEEQVLSRRETPIDDLLEEMAAHRIELNAALVGFTDEHLDQTVHFGGDNKRSPRDLQLGTFLSGWVYHDRWHMEDARRAIDGEAEQPFGDKAFEAATRARPDAGGAAR